MDRTSLGEKSFRFRTRLWTTVSLLIVVPIGFATKFYSGPATLWVKHSLGGVWYEIFWCLLLSLFGPTRRAGSIVAVVFLATCGVEFSQLWRPPWLEDLRNFFLGTTLLGTSFTWSDFPYYALGCSLGWLWLIWLHRGRVRAVAGQATARR